MTTINSISKNPIFDTHSDPVKPDLTRWEKVAKEISIWVARGFIFAAALGISAMAAAFGLHVGGVAGLCVVTSLIGGFAFATAMAIHDKAMKTIDHYFEERAKNRGV